nr:PREDICTED: THAP domain-containing protein 6-like [Linepithema humile]
MPLCIVTNCKNRTASRPILGENKKNNNISYHRFPKNEKLKMLWLDILKLNMESVPPGARICSAHFSKDAFDLSSNTKRLRPNTLPNTEHVAVDAVGNVVAHVSKNFYTTSKIDRATSPISGSSHFVDQSTSMSPQREDDSLEKVYLYKKLQDKNKFYLKKIKVLQQKVRRSKSWIISLKAILDLLKKNNLSETEQLQILRNYLYKCTYNKQ